MLAISEDKLRDLGFTQYTYCHFRGFTFCILSK